MKTKIIFFLLSCTLWTPYLPPAYAEDPPDPIEAEREQAKKWTPSDSEPRWTYQGKDFRIVVYQYRIEFFEGVNSKPVKVLSFQQSVLVNPHPTFWGTETSENIFACTNYKSLYCAQNDHEKRMALLLGAHYDCTPWVNKKAPIDSFCGIVGRGGKIVYEFPKQRFPELLYHPIDITADGKRAGMRVGSEGKLEDPGEDAADDRGIIFKEVWVWEYPDVLRKRKMTDADLKGVINFRKLLRENKL